MPTLPDFLPGRFTLDAGTSRDYVGLECFHYRRKRPRTWAAVVVVRYWEDDVNGRASAQERSSGLFASTEVKYRSCALGAKRGEALESLASPRVVAVGVLSWPTAVSCGRSRALGIGGLTFGQKLRFANAHVRTVSRVVVHPQFRSLGLASAVVRCLCDRCPTRYVEAAAHMGRAHPLFERAGMKRFDPPGPEWPVYYLLDKGAGKAASADAGAIAAPHSEHRPPLARTS